MTFTDFYYYYYFISTLLRKDKKWLDHYKNKFHSVKRLLMCHFFNMNNEKI